MSVTSGGGKGSCARFSRPALTALLVAIVLAAAYTWPLARHASHGMASTHHAGEEEAPRYMIAGDHLQLMYHFWLLADSLWGQTPFFRNPYEFNRGEVDRPIVGAYYAPFGLLFALFYPLTGQPLAWNLTGLAAFWIGLLCLYRLLRGFVSSDGTALAAAAVVFLLPYQWTAFMGGSPTGFAMMWPPVIVLGLDRAVRGGRSWGAWLAGLALLATHWSDTHVFFFSVLSVPAWCAWLLWMRAAQHPGGVFSRAAWGDLWRAAWKLWPVALFMVLAFASALLVRRALDDTLYSGARSAAHIRLFSPVIRGWFGWRTLTGHSSQIYLGIVTGLVLLAGLIPFGRDALKRHKNAWAVWLGYGALLAGILGVAVLALGPHIPGDRNQRVLGLLGRIIPPYRYIRQPAKIYAILPPLLGVAFALSLDRLAGRRRRNVRLLIVCLVAGLAMGDYARRIRPAISLLDRRQEAYAALAADASAQGQLPRAVAIPLWPGDSHWSSLYQYYASLYRVRMLNGYSPVVDRKYFDEIFLRFSPLNTGFVDDEQLDALLEMGIGHLVLHEDAFPEKVSPFPVVCTRNAFLEHPRLRLLARDRAVWAFRIETEPDAEAAWPGRGEAGICFPARFWEAEHFIPASGKVLEAPGETSGGRYARLFPGRERLVIRPQISSHVPGLRFMVRARGPGRAAFGLYIDDRPAALKGAPLEDAWSWVALPVPAFEGYRTIHFTATATDGPIDLDLAYLAAGGGASWELRAGETVAWSADSFFRAGYSDAVRGRVILEADRVPADYIFYGPNHALSRGLYEIELLFESEAQAGTVLGKLSLRHPSGSGEPGVEVVAGVPCRFRYRHRDNRLFGLQLYYTRRADLHLEALRLRRIE